MTLAVEVRRRLGRFTLDVAFRSAGRLTALFGPSGSGKTSLVNLIGGLSRPDAGRIEVDGRVLVDTAARVFVPMHRRRIGYVFQDARLFPHLTVGQNLRYGRFFTPAGERHADMSGVVELLGIGHLLDRRPGLLSGGEKQRVAIGRALIASPLLMLMDEPLASLDDARKAEILPYIERLRDELRLPILYVSHSVPEVARLATTVVALAEGRVVRVGAASEVLADPEAHLLMGAHEVGAVLPASVVGEDPADGLTELAISGGRLWVPRVDAALGARVRLHIRARDLILADHRPTGLSTLNALPATVTWLGAGGGAAVDVGLACGEDRLIARITRRSLQALRLAPGAACWVVFKSVAVSREDIGSFEDRDA